MMNFGIMSMILPLYGLLYYLGLFLVLYLVARWRDGKESSADPQLGYKFGLNTFKFLSYNLIFGSLAVLLFSLFYTLISGNSFNSNTLRIAGGLLAPGLIIFGVMYALLSKTNQNTHLGVNRLFAGLSWIISGVIALGAFTVLSQSLFMAMFSSRYAFQWAIAASLLLVFIPAFLYFGTIVKKTSAIK